ncbi:putative inactive histone-lysine N-methyltransferase SUVR2 isoform X2 [Nicotiana tabacum]|uniref:Inactive histone-lysine N-methyltransferase SUVR2 isoform X2 n=1 Tax=Nicotiana tabacum TaxID=4097 RepID=A0A1S3YCU3_TOBAC|nr:PREDICTED: probable inactive histone-lysine N-methyltransferase SUVR2 isoform X2 [Nicotiana tabacum]
MALKSKVKRACEAMEVFGYTEEIVKPVLRNLLNLYNKNWKLIEDENYSALLESLIDSEESKERQKSLLEDEPEENEPPLKRSRFCSQRHHSSPAKHDPSPSADTCTSELQPPSKHKMAGFTPESYETEDVELKPLLLKDYQGKGKKQSSSEASPISERDNDIVLLSDNDMKEPVTMLPHLTIKERGDTSLSYPALVPKRRLCFGCREEPSGIGSSDASNEGALVEYDLRDAMPLNEPFSDNLPDFDVPLAVAPSEGSRRIERQDLEFLNSEYLGTEGNGKGVTSSSQLDIASSQKGEVKIFFAHKPYCSSDFHPPSLDAVLKRMEEKYIKSYRISQPDFSLLRLMEKLCECYLTAGTKARPANEPSAGIESQKLHPVGVRYDAANHELHFAPDISNGSFKLSNLIKVSPQIPKFPASGNRDIVCYMMNFNGTKIHGAEKDKTNKVLKLLAPSTMKNSLVVQKNTSSPGLPSSAYYFEDITNGQEVHRISLINEFSHEILPVFKYIPKNIIFQNAYVKFLLARISDDNCCSNCSEDCLSPDIPCACAGETGGEFAYTSGGLLKEKFLENCISMNREPQRHGLVYCQDCPLERSKNNSMSGVCKGHLVRKFIKECWHKCGCSRECGNRVVQRGIAVPLQVFMTAHGKGWGLRTLEDLPRGAFVCEYVGEIVTNTELYERNTQTADERHTYPVLLDADWGSEGVLKDEEALCLDATSYGNIARFINHRCYDANLVEIPVEVETPDHHYYHVAFFTTRKVNALEELTWDYGIDFTDHSHPVKAFKCCCGSELCRDIKSLKRARK